MYPIEVKFSKNYTTTSLLRFKEKFSQRIGESYIIHPKKTCRAPRRHNLFVGIYDFLSLILRNSVFVAAPSAFAVSLYELGTQSRVRIFWLKYVDPSSKQLDRLDRASDQSGRQDWDRLSRCFRSLQNKGTKQARL